MPIQPQLNPDALEAAAKELFLEDENTAYVKYPEWDSPENVGKPDYIENARAAVSAYLATALPEVTDMDGLRALPADTILEASGKMLDGTFHQCMIRKLPDFVTGTDGTVDPGFECLSYTSSQIVTEVFFPARVLYRPEANDV